MRGDWALPRGVNLLAVGCLAPMSRSSHPLIAWHVGRASAKPRRPEVPSPSRGPHLVESRMPNQHFGTRPIGPDEGEYDVRKGASSYSGIAASIGSLAVTAIVVIFTVPRDKSVPEQIALATGLLSIAFMGSILGAFALAAIGAEKDPTANLGTAVLFAGLPISLAVVSTFGAFEVLASIYTPASSALFTTMTGAIGAFAVMFASASIPDSMGLHPTTLTPEEFDKWRERQWLQDRPHALRAMYLVMAVCGIPIILTTAISVLFDLSPSLANFVVGVIVLLGAAFVLFGTVMSFVTHPTKGNDQKALRAWGAWTPNVLIAGFACLLLLTLP